MTQLGQYGMNSQTKSRSRRSFVLCMRSQKSWRCSFSSSFSAALVDADFEFAAAPDNDVAYRCDSASGGMVVTMKS